MQSSYSLSITDIKPARGILLCEAEPDQFETSSGLLAIRTTKKNPKIYKAKVISLGGPFVVHGKRHCRTCHPVCTRKYQEGRYWAKPGDTIWMKRGFKKQMFEGKMYLFVPNEDVLTAWEEE